MSVKLLSLHDLLLKHLNYVVFALNGILQLSLIFGLLDIHIDIVMLLLDLPFFWGESPREIGL